ncbi:MAG: endolytic transglycosylase MltG [Chitinophagaceae bacterium]
MKRKIIIGSLIILATVVAYFGWLFFSGTTQFPEKSKYLFIQTNKASYGEVLQTLKDSQFINNETAFNFLANRMKLQEKIKAGRYEITKGMSLLDIARLLKNGKQTPLNLVIIKLRTKEDLAAFIGKRFECDSTDIIHFLNNADSLKPYELDSNTVMTGIFPNTYQLFWNSTPSIVFKKLFAESASVWTKERIQLATVHELTPTAVYILASIVEEETRAKEEKGNMASVYINRYKKGMRLQADPTVKFALRNFGLKRIYEKHLTVESPYNTYRNAGLPPGPICTPSLETIDAVLNSPATNYLYFVAKSDFSGRHVFSETYEEHLKNAREFQQALDKQQKIKAAKEDTGS